MCEISSKCKDQEIPRNMLYYTFRIQPESSLAYICSWKTKSTLQDARGGANERQCPFSVRVLSGRRRAGGSDGSQTSRQAQEVKVKENPCWPPGNLGVKESQEAVKPTAPK